jgi:hypothetical protein
VQNILFLEVLNSVWRLIQVFRFHLHD